MIAIADVERKLMSLAAAEDTYTEALRIVRCFVVDDAPQEDLAECLNGLGMCAMLSQGRKAEAMDVMGRCVDMTVRLLGPTHRHTMNRKRNMKMAIDNEE